MLDGSIFPVLRSDQPELVDACLTGKLFLLVTGLDALFIGKDPDLKKVNPLGLWTD